MRTIWVYKGTPNPPVKPSAVLNRGIVFSFLGLDVESARDGKGYVAAELFLHQAGERRMQPSGLVRVLIVLASVAVALPGFAAAASGHVSDGTASGSTLSAMSAPTTTQPFFPNIRVTDGSSGFTDQVEPTMVVNHSGAIVVGWKETNGDTAAGLRVGASYSLDQGATWAPNILMNQSHPGQGCHNSDPWMALAPDDRVQYAYLEYDCSPTGLNVANTTDGQTWSTPHFMLGGGGLTDKDSITVDPFGRIYAAWDEGNEMMISWSDDGGAHWAPFVFPDDTCCGVLGAIIQTSSNGTVYLTWWDFGSDNIFFDWSSDRGITWHTDVRVNSVPGSAQGAGSWSLPMPAMGVDPNSGTIYNIWTDSRGGGLDIMIAASTNGGQSWGTNVRVNDVTTGDQRMPDLAIDNAGTVHAAWIDDRTGNHNIFYANSTNGGQTWSTNLKVTDEESSASLVRPGDYFAIEAGPQNQAYVLWTDGRTSDGSDYEIYFARNPGFPGATLTASTNPAGLKVQIDGATYTSPAQKVVVIGSTHSVSTPDPQVINPTSRYIWTSWSDGGARTHTVTLDTDLSVVASFKKQFQAKFAISPIASPGPTILVDNQSYGAPATFWWDQGSAHWLEAPSPQLTAPDSRFVFVSWSDSGARAHGVTANAPVDATATFQPERTLLVATDPGGLDFTLDGGLPQTGPATFWLALGSTHSIAVDTLQSGGAGVQYRYLEWSDHGAPSHAITISSGMAVTARFKTEFYLTVDSADPLSTGQGWYLSGSTAYATVTNPIQSVGPGERQAFHGWGGDATGAGTTSDPILMDGPKTATALFGTEYYLDVQSAYGTVTGTGWYASGNTAYASAPATVPVSSGSRRAFNGWGGDASGSGTTSAPILMNGPKVAIASWKLQYNLRIDSPYGTVLNAGWYDTGTQTTARLDMGTVSLGVGARAQFQAWYGDATGTDSSGSSSITMDHAHLVVAVWQVQYYLTVETTFGSASGSGWYANGSFGLASVNASIIPVSGTERQAFAGWSGDASGSSGALSNPIPMDRPKSARATWKVEYLVRVDSDIQVQIDGGGWYAAGTQATLRAPQEVASGGQTYRFSGWTGGVTSSATEVLVTVNGPLVVHANWATVGILGGTTLTYGLIIVIVVIAIVIALVVARSRRRRQ